MKSQNPKNPNIALLFLCPKITNYKFHLIRLCNIRDSKFSVRLESLSIVSTVDLLTHIDTRNRLKNWLVDF